MLYKRRRRAKPRPHQKGDHIISSDGKFTGVIREIGHQLVSWTDGFSGCFCPDSTYTPLSQDYKARLL